jgi:hypothetical protein
MRSWTVFVAFLALALIAAPQASAQTARPYDLQLLAPEVRSAVEASRAAQTRALMAAARAQGDETRHTRFTGVGGDSYAGECSPCTGENPQRHGAGLLSWTDGEIYAGDHVRGGNGGLKQGYGVYIFANGTMFEGQYVNDQYHGYGAFWDANGRLVQHGTWVNGQHVR